MARKINEEWFDALIRHQIHLLRLSGGVRNKVIALLNKSDLDIQGKILTRLQDIAGGATPRNLQRVAVLQRIIRNSRNKTWAQVNKLWFSELKAIVKSEPITIAGTLQTVVPVQLAVNIPPVRQLVALVTHNPFQGRTLKEWATDVKTRDLQRIRDQVVIGITQGENNRQIARRVAGSVAMKGKDGVTQITRNQIAAVTRTAVNSYSNAARTMFFQENSDLFKEELFVATLDDRTTLICSSNDGKQFKVGEGPIPPLHFGCRSLRVAVIDGAELGNRPAKPFTERQLVQEYAKKNRLGDINARDRLPRGFKGSFDKFKQQRVRQLTGRVPGKMSYEEWLRSQPKQFQEEILGKTKAKLFSDGNLRLEKYVDRSGSELTLAELARREATAFRAAGLDPRDYVQ